jgi:methionyl-tRNA formyltransferase
MKKPRILFIGGTARGFALLRMLQELKEDIVYAYIMPEDAHENARSSGEMLEFCHKHKIPAEISKKINCIESDKILRLSADVAFVCGWRTIIPQAVYKQIPLGCLTAHDSLLPKYRGFAPLNWAIINGEKQSGVTLFKIQDGPVDSGDICGQKKVAIGPAQTAAEVYPHIIEATLDLYRDFLKDLRAGKIMWRRQNEKLATYACKRTPKDGQIDWNKSAGEIFNLIRALSPPYPCAWTYYQGKKVCIGKATLPLRQLMYAGNIAGRVAAVLLEGVLVLCGRGQIIINTVLTEEAQCIEANKLFNSISVNLGR